VPPEARDRWIVAMTRLHPKKRLRHLIEAFHQIATGPEAGQWELVIAGEGEAGYRAALERTAAGGPAAARIRFVGWLSGEAKRDCLSRAAVFALPSFQENFGIGLLEALARGVPAVVSRGVNLATSIEAAGAGWVVGQSDGELARALAAAIGDVEDRTRRSHAARAMAAAFTWERAATDLERLYESVRPLPVGGRG
jgi:glycosyltransferase involved in cell wall biosynthesis